jgi:hypothetical protein
MDRSLNISPGEHKGITRTDMQPTSTRVLTNNLGDGFRLGRLEIDEEDLIKPLR